MMTCEECKDGLRPSDPSVGWVNLNWKRNHPHEYPKYDPPLCDACPDKPVEKTIIYQEDYQWTNRQWDKVQQLESKVLFLQRKLNDSLKEKKTIKKTNRYKYK